MNPKTVLSYDKYFLSDRLENKKVYAESFDDDELDWVDKENTKSACAGVLTENDLIDFFNRMLDKMIEEK